MSGSTAAAKEESWEDDSLFQAELNAAMQQRPVSASRIGALTKIALHSGKFYKHAVYRVERALAHSRPEQRLALLYVIDAICRGARAKLGEREPFSRRFAANIGVSAGLIAQAPPSDAESVRKVLGLWRKHATFDEDSLRKFAAALDATAKSDTVVVPAAGDIREEPMDGDDEKGAAAATAADSTPKMPQAPLFPAVDPRIFAAFPPIAASVLPPQPVPVSMPQIPAEAFAYDYGDEEDDDDARVRALEERVRLEQQRLAAKEEQPAVESAESHAPAAEAYNPDISDEEIQRAPAMPQQPPPFFQQQQQPQFPLQQQPPPRVQRRPRPQQSSEPPPPGFTKVQTTTLFVGNVTPDAAELLGQHFAQFGTVTKIRAMLDKNIAFVTFQNRPDAEAALAAMADQPVGGTVLKVGWGRGLLPAEGFDRNTGEGLVPVGGVAAHQQVPMQMHALPPPQQQQQFQYHAVLPPQSQEPPQPPLPQDLYDGSAAAPMMHPSRLRLIQQQQPPSGFEAQPFRGKHERQDESGQSEFAAKRARW